MIYLKNQEQIAGIKAAVGLWKTTITALKKLIVPNNTPLDLAKAAEQIVRAAGGKLVFQGYHGFPGALCVSVNEVGIHGIPDNTKFKPTDKVGVDLGISLNGYICDAGFSQIVDPATNPEYQQLAEHTYQALMAGISAAKAGNYTGDITTAISQYVAENCPQYQILNDFCGHGCGIHLHEDPSVLNKGLRPKTGTQLVSGMVLCIEPILTDQADGSYTIDQKDKWSVRVKPRAKVCHWEHMVLILDNQTEVLTAFDAEETGGEVD
ncbi:methionyl aminopeptidase [Mycoplasmoides fastidiosum]|uniref:Methionine aminopeptidase n=1 Tax=Mycoplasmoides fastidiosum TaxID=92758 RepID=A0ABU0LYD9_9BACT|nr:type I methionyl aminopeptidase [Mycoplasmoides fastidiosum]MDQ0513613.1 methionyl aminopeptidase [Mycoplasmoides fastidiosum]UUD37964.1 type I methionyl aminopeptidase [Mycoplasmoides fastidiosum]